MAKSKKSEVEEVEKETELKDEIDKSEAPEASLTDQEVDLESAQKETETEESVAAEVAAINTDNDTAREATVKTEKKPGKAKKAKPQAKPKKKSSKYTKAIENLELGKLHSIAEAVELVKKTSYSKFDGSVDLAIKLEKSKKGADDAVRGTIKLPHGTGKKKNIEVATDEVIEKIKKGAISFDVLIATPAQMPKLAQVAKILGPKGKMPNPKDGTVVEDPKQAIAEMESIAMYRTDIGRNVHIAIGRVSWDSAKLAENINTVLKALAHLKKESATLSATMGPGVMLDIKG